MISDISHQTVTPLSNIMLYSQLLEEGLEGMPQQPQAEAVRKQAEKLDFLITSLVKSSRLETGIIKTEPAPCDLYRLLESVAEQAAAKAEEKDILLRVEEPEEPVLALCDGKWTREACFNLVDNAVKYTGSGGRVELSVTGYSMFARIDVKDCGSGITEEEIPRIFGRFYRSRQAAQEEGSVWPLFGTPDRGMSGRLHQSHVKAGAGQLFFRFSAKGVKAVKAVSGKLQPENCERKTEIRTVIKNRDQRYQNCDH